MDDSPIRPPGPIEGDGHPPIQCDACLSALHEPDRATMAYLLIDQLTVPITGCENHRQQFRSICEFSTDRDVDLLEHHPAGGITCPSCQRAPHRPHHPVIPLGNGVITVIACPSHETVVLERFQTGLQTQQQLTASLDS